MSLADRWKEEYIKEKEAHKKTSDQLNTMFGIALILGIVIAFLPCK